MIGDVDIQGGNLTWLKVHIGDENYSSDSDQYQTHIFIRREGDDLCILSDGMTVEWRLPLATLKTIVNLAEDGTLKANTGDRYPW